MILKSGLFLPGLVLAFVCAPTSFAQTNQGQLNGAATDASGAAVPGVRIEVKNPETGVTFNTISNESGQYLLYLPFGRYELRATGSGFATKTITPIIVSTASVTTVNIEMSVAQVSEELTVAAGVAQLETTSTTVNVNVEQKLLEDVPVPVQGNKRRPYQYIAMSPAVNTNGFNTIAGGRNNSSAILLDGLGTDIGNQGLGEDAAGNEPSVEAIGEYTMLINSTAAEYGRTSGAVLSYSTRSGTNDFHGSAWDYHNNSALSARPWQAAAREISHSNEFGIAIGGPVVIPFLYNGRNRTFFWATAGAYRQNASGSSSALESVPTAAMRKGDFSDPRIGTIYDILNPYTDASGQVRRQAFPGNQIPISRLSKTSKFFMDLLPLPNRGDSPTLNFVGTSSGNFTPWDYTVKIDHNFTAAHRVSGFYQVGTQDRSTTDATLGANFGQTSFDNIHRVRFDYTWVIRPNLVNTFLFGVNRNTFGSQRANFGQSFGQKAGLQGLPDPNCPEVLLNRASPGEVDICPGQPANTNDNTVTSLGNSTLWVRGSHTIKFGYQYMLWHTANLQTGGALGPFSVSAAGTYQFGDVGSSGLNTRDTNGQGGFHLADFFLGLPTFAGTVAALNLGNRESYHALFVQDDWKVNRRLTINAGLRWDVNVPFTEEHSRYTAFDPTRPNPGASDRLGALSYYGTGPGENGMTRIGNIHWKNFAPRLGLAYQVDSKTVFRAFAGLIFNAIQSGNALYANRTGFIQSGSIPPNPDPYGVYFQWDNPFPANVLGKVPNTDPAFRNNQEFRNWMAVNDIGRSPVSQDISAGFQRQLSKNVLVEATYIANLLRHGSDHAPVNQLAPQYWSLGPLLNMPITSPAVVAAGFKKPYPEFPNDQSLARALSPYPQYSTIDNDASTQTNSDYNAVMFKVQQRYSNGLTFLAHWTIAKQIGDTDWRPGAFGSRPRDQYNRKLDKTVERFDTPQRLVLNYSYELPFGPGKKLASNTGTIGKYALNGWTISGVHEYMGGYPVSMTGGLSVPIPAGADFSTRPNRVLGVPIRSKLACSQMEFGNPAKDYILNAGNPEQAARTGRPLPFAPEGDYQLGNAPVRDQSARQCPNLNENFSLLKTFPIFKERVRFVLGADCFNCLNRHRWITFKFGQATSDATFGEIQPDQPYGPRTIQVRLRLEW